MQMGKKTTAGGRQRQLRQHQREIVIPSILVRMQLLAARTLRIMADTVWRWGLLSLSLWLLPFSGPCRGPGNKNIYT